MRGLDPRIRLFEKRWIAGSSPAMTNGNDKAPGFMECLKRALTLP
ncbi:MAG: hypothetical protein WBA48_01720 [Xanthobacteraceae bacterium]